MKQLAQAAPNAGSPLVEELMDRIAYYVLLLGAGHPALDMHQQREWRIGWKILAPAHDEFFRSRVEIAIVEGRGIDAIEQLP